MNKVIRTSESVSFNKVRNIGSIYSLVPFLPITGANDNNDVAIEFLTKELVSTYIIFSNGISLVLISSASI